MYQQIKNRNGTMVQWYNGTLWYIWLNFFATDCLTTSERCIPKFCAKVKK